MANNEFGDFQTNPQLAKRVAALLSEISTPPATIVEPTCGKGNFIEAVLQFYPETVVHGLEINPAHIRELESRFQFNPRVILHLEDYFSFEWSTLVERMAKPVWVIGNPPWVTNTQLVRLESSNLPKKSPQAHLKGIEAQTGKSNFDISESMIRDWFRWCSSCDGSLAVICKTSVARKVLQWWWKSGNRPPKAQVYLIDAKAEFDVSVAACVLVCSFQSACGEQTCAVFESMSAQEPISEFAVQEGVLIANAKAFVGHKALMGRSTPQWRSGIKHDAGKVLELSRKHGALFNKVGEKVVVDEGYVYPLIKGSDLHQIDPHGHNRQIIVPQTRIGESTAGMQDRSPLTWAYLNENTHVFDSRKSVIYKNGDRFSIFGIGEYSFMPWKIAIAALYKSLHFCLIGPRDGKPVMFDDTIYFIGFKTQQEAEIALEKITDMRSQSFLNSMIFWDDMRPIKTEILNRLDLSRLELKQAA